MMNKATSEFTHFKTFKYIKLPQQISILQIEEHKRNPLNIKIH